jgi:hypothetical protein
MTDFKQQLQSDINEKQPNLNHLTWQEFEDINGETYNHKDGFSCTLKYKGSPHFESKKMFLTITVGEKSNNVFFTFDENGFKVLNERCNHPYDGDKYIDSPILPTYGSAHINFENGIEDAMSKVQSFFDWNNKVEMITNWLNNEYVPSFNHRFDTLISECNKLSQMKSDLENYDEFQYQKLYNQCIENGVVNIDSHSYFDYEVNDDNDLESITIGERATSVKTKYQTTYGTTRNEYISDEVRITPIKGGKFEMEYDVKHYRNGSVAGVNTYDGIFTKLQFTNFIKDVWYSNTKIAEREMDEINESIEHIDVRYGFKVELPLESGKYYIVDNKLQLEKGKVTA